MKILKLTSNNVLRLDAVEIEPCGNTIVIGGKNGAGKTSVLDSILLALGGRQAKHAIPLKKGSKKGKVEIDLGDYSVIRTFTQNGGSLSVTSKDGAKYPSPQAMLDKITGQLTFDPLAWCAMDSRKQLETLKEMVGLDFTKQDEKRKLLFDERTNINREGKELKARYDSMEDYPDAPEKEVLVSELMEELEKRQTINKNNDIERNYIIGINSNIDEVDNEIGVINEAIEDLKLKIDRYEAQLQLKTTKATTLRKELKDQKRYITNLTDANEQVFMDHIAVA